MERAVAGRSKIPLPAHRTAHANQPGFIEMIKHILLVGLGGGVGSIALI